MKSMRTLVLKDNKEFDGILYAHPSNLSSSEDKYLYLVVSARKDIDKQVIQFYTTWLAETVSKYKFENSKKLHILQILAKKMDELGATYLFWEYEITGFVIIDNLTGKEKMESFGKISVSKHGLSKFISYQSDKSTKIIATLEVQSTNLPPEKRPWLMRLKSLLLNQVKSIFKNPTVKKSGIMLFWLILGMISYLILTTLLNPLIH